MSPDLDDLASRALVDDDEIAWRVLFAAVTPRLFGLARSWKATDTEAEDLIQETWLRVHRSKTNYTQKGKFWNYVSTVACHLWLDALRKKCRRPCDQLAEGEDPSSDGQQPIDEIIEAETSDQIEQWRETLTDEEKKIVSLRFGDEELPFAEIANRLGSSEGAVRSKCYRAVGGLRQHLGIEVSQQQRHPDKAKSAETTPKRGDPAGLLEEGSADG